MESFTCITNHCQRLFKVLLVCDFPRILGCRDKARACVPMLLHKLQHLCPLHIPLCAPCVCCSEHGRVHSLTTATTFTKHVQARSRVRSRRERANAGHVDLVPYFRVCVHASIHAPQRTRHRAKNKQRKSKEKTKKKQRKRTARRCNNGWAHLWRLAGDTLGAIKALLQKSVTVHAHNGGHEWQHSPRCTGTRQKREWRLSERVMQV